MEPPKMTKKKRILRVLQFAGRPLACHEFKIQGIDINDHAANTRLNELRKEAVRDNKPYRIESRKRHGKDYQEWYIAEAPAAEPDQVQTRMGSDGQMAWDLSRTTSA